MEMVSIETIEEEILNLEKRDTSYAVCERLAWLYIPNIMLSPILHQRRVPSEI